MQAILTGLALLIAFLAASIVTDLRYVNRLDRLRAERDAWEETALRENRNAEYYRSLLVKCGMAIGVAAYTDDAGEEHDDVLCAKIPELVDELVSFRNAVATRTPKWQNYAIAVEDVKECVDNLRPGWGVFKVVAKMADGSIKEGTAQGDGQDLWALNTFEHEP